MAMKCPFLLAPAMNTNMLTSVAYQNNEKILRERGAHFVVGGSGFLACGDVGSGRLAEPDEIVRAIYDVLTPNPDYDGKTVLVTAGGTSENIDPVRFIANRSTGKQGVAIAKKALDRGAKVILVTGNISVPVPSGVEQIKVVSTKEMYDAVMSNLERADVIIKAAAPADYTVAYSDTKIKDESFTLTFTKTVDIASEVGKVKGDKKLVVFSAETNDCLENARKKLVKKNADLAVLNDVTKAGAGFGTDTNIVTLITKDSEETLPIMEKSEIADIILDKVLKL
jgi:phosphopantothenoylcysteine decarboxylase/phosphopantothenate--cysteine ligase